jgi:hypothetical protein
MIDLSAELLEDRDLLTCFCTGITTSRGIPTSVVQ